MGRGFMYGIAETKEGALAVSSSDLWDRAGYDFDWIEDNNDVESIRCLMRKLKKLGATIGRRYKKGCDPIFWFTLPEGFKQKYFKPQFEKFKEAANKLTLDEYAAADPYEVRWLLNDSYSDAVYDGDEFKSLDDFVRYAVTGQRYWVTKSYYMH